MSASSEVLEALAEYAADRTSTVAIAELDERGTILASNAAFERLAGRPLAGLAASDLLAPGQRDTLAAVLSGAADGWHHRLLGLFPDDRGIPLDFSIFLRRVDRGWLLIAEPADAAVTEVNERLLSLNDELSRAQRQIRRQNAELSRQNDRLRELDALKDSLLANVSHDLRTPLTAILGYAELMRRRGGLNEKHAKSAAVIERNARRLLRLVDDLLLLAQARAGQLRIERQPVNVAELAAEVHELARPLADQARLAIALEVPEEGAAVVSGDRLRLGQLLENLIANAIKFTPAGGAVAIRVRARGDRVCAEVADTGPGISPDDQARLYEAFVRGSTASVPGTGLGLAIVSEVANAHGATVDLDSRPGHGTRFTVCLPAVAEG